MNTVHRLLRIAAAALAIHGLLLALAGAAQSLLPDTSFELVGQIAFWVLAMPALVLTLPFTSLLWRLHLIHATGWFAWPEPLGMALAYGVWIAALLALAGIVRLVQLRSRASPGAKAG